jgi:hypothetical protein
MGLREIHGYGGGEAGALALARLAHRVVSDAAERERRRLAQERVDLYYEMTASVLENAVFSLFTDATVRAKLRPFLKLGGATNLFRRTIDEVAGPIYQIPPTRKVLPTEGREPDKDASKKYRELAKAVRLDKRMDLACHLGQASNHVFLVGRQPKSLPFPVVEVMTPAQVTVLTHPDDAQLEVGLVYDREYRGEKARVLWDDTEMVVFSAGGQLLKHEPHTLGRVPWVAIHMTERPGGQYWDMTTGTALFTASVCASLLTALTMKLHKTHGFRQIIVTGDVVNFPKEQSLDEEAAILAPEGTSISTLDMATPGSHYLATLADIVTRAAADRGISLERLNAKAGSESEDVGLEERRADAIKVFRSAEEDAFDLLTTMRAGTVTAGSRLETDYGELTMRTDPMGTLQLWEKQEERGLRNVLDDIRAMNPEIDSDEEAWSEFERNLDVRAKKIEMLRKLNMSATAGAEMPGQNAQQNGALGPAVRDGRMTKDEAAEQSEGAPPEADE